MNCLFRLDHYQIESVAVAHNEQFDPKLPAHTGDISATINIAPHTKEQTKYRLTLEILVKPTTGQEQAFFPYEISVTGRGFFSFKAPCDPEKADHVLRLNGAAILSGLLRGQIAQITAQSVHGQFLLPTVNFVELQEQAQAMAAKPEPKRAVKAKPKARKPLKGSR
jgi:preprotein translocase subunit SecB